MDRTGDALPPGLYFAVLGPLAAWRDGTRIELGSPQQQALLALLVLRRNERTSTELLVDQLWGAHPPPNGVQAIRNYVSRLRRAMVDASGTLLVTEAGGYRLAVEDDRVDLHRFEVRMSAGRAALLAGDPLRAERRLRSALRLIRDVPFAGLEYNDALAHERERFEELSLFAEEDLVDALLAQGRHGELIPQLRERLARYPFRERFWAQLMLALYRSDHQSEALEVYRQARRGLRDELGIEPGRELRTLERMILLQERTLDHEMVARLHGVPRHQGRVIGRRADLAFVRGRLRRARLMTLVGPAGVGKTRLAAEVAAAVRTRFPDGIWWIGLESTDGPEVVSTVARAIGLRDGGHAAPVDLVVARLRGSRALLVLDDCDRVAAEVSDLAQAIVGGTEGAAVLATSREPLSVEDEEVHPVEPLPIPDAGVPADEILRNDSVRLLLSRSGAGGDVRGPGTADAHSLREVVTRLDGLPLAIELAAGMLVAMSPAELARSLATGLGLLRDGGRSGLERHRTLDAALAWSYDLLDADQQQVLRRLSAFPSSFDASAADAVASDASAGVDALSVIVHLVRKSLVVADLGDPTRYRLLGIAREFARGLATPDELAAAARRHRDHYLGIAEGVAAHMLDGELGAWLPVGTLEHENLRAALRWSMEAGEGEPALQIASALGAFWYRIGHVSEGRVLLDGALALAEPTGPWRARGLVNRAWLADAAGAPDTLQLARVAAESAEPGSELRAFALAQVGQQEVLAGIADETDPALVEARAIFERIGQAEGLALIEQIAGRAALRRGDVAGAIHHLSRSRDRYRDLRGDLDAGWTLVLLAQAALAGTDLELAAESAAAAVRDFRLRGDQRGVAAGLTCLGRARLAADDGERGRTLLVEALRIAQANEYGPEAAEARRALEAVPAVPG